MSDGSEKPLPGGASEPHDSAPEPSISEIGYARVAVPKEVLIRKLKESKEVRLRVFSDGTATAECKACHTDMQPAEKDGLIWLLCPGCRGITFVPIQNLQRDRALAMEEGGAFEYELFLIRNLPPGLTPPDASA